MPLIVCDNCGHQNPEGTDFCQGCQRYLQWTGTRVDEQPVSGVLAMLSSAELRVHPGAEVVAELEVRNMGTIVDAFDVELPGPEAAWITAEPAQVRLFPRATGTVRLRIAPPRQPEIRAGPTPFTVQVISTTDGRVGAEERGQIVVEPFRELAARLVPTRSEGVTAATHRVEVANHGNAPVEATLAAIDPDERLAFDVQPAGPFRLEPGAGQVVTVGVEPPHAGDEALPRTWQFQVRLEVAGGAPVVVDGTMVQLAVTAPRLGARLVPVHSEGVTSATHRLEVTNQGDGTVDARVVASDPDEGLTFIVQPSGLFRLTPGASGSIMVDVSPRRPLADARPRTWPFQVRLEAAGGAVVAVDGVMVQRPAPAPRVTAKLVPLQSEAVTFATHHVEVANEGDAPADVRVLASDRGGGLTFDVQPPGLFPLPPAVSRAVAVVVTPRRRLRSGGRPRALPFQVRVEALGAAPVPIEGVMVQQPPAPAPARRRGCGCLLLVIVVGVAAAVAIVLALPALQGSSFGSNLPSLPSLPRLP
ncbi:MAG TPA: zinc ribbon domain-containing protein [Candidatus Dormibacteraeota bacterium]|jgi:hypothetical protein